MAKFTVTTTSDIIDANDGVLSLREAIIAANDSQGADKIDFDLGTGQQTIALDDSLGTLQITDKVQIVGSTEADDLIISGDSSFDIFNVDNGADVTLKNLTISGGSDGIQVDDGSLTVDNSIIIGSSSEGIDFNANDSELTVTDTVISETDSEGIEIDGDGNQISIKSSTIEKTENDGFEVDGDNNSIQVVDSIFADNNFDGIDIGGANNDLLVTNSTIRDNDPLGNLSGSGIEIEGNHTVNVTNSTISGNGDSGVQIEEGTSDVVLFNNLITGNITDGDGGGVFVGSGNEVTLRNNTITGNTADSDANGIGDGGGLFVELGATVTVAGTTITDNFDTPGNAGPGDIFANVFGDFTDLGGNNIGI